LGVFDLSPMDLRFEILDKVGGQVPLSLYLKSSGKYKYNISPNHTLSSWGD